MSSYSLSGSGTHPLTASTTGLQVTITTPSVIQGVGRSNPVAHYDVGLIRFSDGTSYWAPIPVLGGPQFIPVPANASSMGYALLGGAVISVTEVIGGTLFFSAGTQSVETLSDVQVTSIADGQTLEWNAAASKWKNVTPATGGGVLGHASAVLGSDVAINAVNTYFDIVSFSLGAGTWIVWTRVEFYNAVNVINSFNWRVTDGTTIYAGGDFSESGSSFIADSSGVCLVVLTGTTTVKLRVKTSGDTNGFVKSAMTVGDSGNTQMVALQVA